MRSWILAGVGNADCNGKPFAVASGTPLTKTFDSQTDCRKEQRDIKFIIFLEEGFETEYP